MLKIGNQTLHRDKIGILCQKWYITELVLYGSALCEEIGEHGTIQLLVSFEEDSRTDLFQLVQMVRELEDIFGCKVKLLSRKFVENNPDYSIHQKDLVFQEIIYSSRKSHG